MIPKFEKAAKHPVTPSWKPSTNTSISSTASDCTPVETPPQSSSSNNQSVEDIDPTTMENSTEGTTKQEEKAPASDSPNAQDEASSTKPDGPATFKETTSTVAKIKKSPGKKNDKSSKKSKKHSKAVETDSDSDSDDSSSYDSSSSSSDDSSDPSSEEDEATKKKRKSKAKKEKKRKARRKAKAKAKAGDTDSDSSDESSSSEEEKKQSRKKRQLKKKRAKKSKVVEEEDEEEEAGDDNEDVTINKQQLAQLQAICLNPLAKRAVRGSAGETEKITGESGKKDAKAKGKPGKRSVFCTFPSTDIYPLSEIEVNYSSCSSQWRSGRQFVYVI